MADGQQQGPLGVQHLANVVAHGVQRGRQFAQLIGPLRVAQCNRLAEVPRAKAACTFANGVQRPEQSAHIQPGQQRQQQHSGQCHTQQARTALQHRFVDAKFDGVPIGCGSPDQPVPGFVVTPLVAAVVALSPGRLLLVRVGTPVDHRPSYVDCQWEALGNGPGLLGAGWCGCTGGADVCGQTVHIVHQQGPGGFAPAQRKRLLRAGDEHQRHGRCQQQEQQHHAQLDGMGQPTPDAEPRRHPLVSNRSGLHEVTGRSASE